MIPHGIEQLTMNPNLSRDAMFAAKKIAIPDPLFHALLVNI